MNPLIALEANLKARYDACQDHAATPSSILLAVLNAVADVNHAATPESAQEAWQPIATLPTDGGWYRLLHKDGRVIRGGTDGRLIHDGSGWLSVDQFTHWSPEPSTAAECDCLEWDCEICGTNDSTPPRGDGENDTTKPAAQEGVPYRCTCDSDPSITCIVHPRQNYQGRVSLHTDKPVMPEGEWLIVEAWVHGGKTAELKLQRMFTGTDEAQVLDLAGSSVAIAQPAAQEGVEVFDWQVSSIRYGLRLGESVDDAQIRNALAAAGVRPTLGQDVGEVDEALFQNTAAEHGEAQDDGGWYFDADAFDAFCTALTAARPPAGAVDDAMAAKAEAARVKSLNAIVAYGSMGIDESHNRAMKDALIAVLAPNDQVKP